MSENNTNQEELLKQIKEYLENHGISMEDFLKVALDALKGSGLSKGSPNPNNEEIAIKETFSIYDTEEQTSDVEDGLSGEELENFRRKCNEISEECFAEIIPYTSISNFPNTGSAIYHIILDAKDGKILPGEFDKYGGINGLPSEHEKDVYKLSFLCRERAYAYYNYSTDEEMEKQREAVISLYKGLKSAGELNFSIFSAEGKFNDEQPSLTSIDYASRRAGTGESSYGIDYDPNYVYRPNAFDTRFIVLARTLTGSTDRTIPEILYKRYQGETNEIIDQLEKMNIDEFRKFKIDQMGLTDEEMSRIKEDIRTFKKELQPTP